METKGPHTHTPAAGLAGLGEGGVRVMGLSQLLSYSAPTRLAEGGQLDRVVAWLYLYLKV